MANELLPVEEWKLKVEIGPDGTLKLEAGMWTNNGWLESIFIPFSDLSHIADVEQLAKLANARMAEYENRRTLHNA